jgi:hypothetical protein
MDKRSWCWVGCWLAFIVAATAGAAFYFLLQDGYDQQGARYGALIYGAIVGIPLSLAVIGISLWSANLMTAARVAGRIEAIAEARRSGRTGRRQ